MTSSRALCYLRAVKKEKHELHFVFVQCIIKQLLDSFFCNIQNNQGLGKGYKPQRSASADNPYLDLDYSGCITKTSSNNCLLLLLEKYVKLNFQK